MKKNVKKNLTQLTQQTDKSQLINQSMKNSLKGGGSIIVEDGVIL